MREPEEKIPVNSPNLEIFFVVDCPSLHIVPFSRLGPRREHPALESIPSICFAPDGSAKPADITLTPPLPQASPSLSASPEVVQFVKAPRHAPTPSDTVTQFSLATSDSGSLMRNPPSPTLPEPLSTLQSIDRELASIHASTPSRLSTTPDPKRSGLFNFKWSKSKPSRKDTRPTSTLSQSSGDAVLPKFLSFCFSLTGENLLIWRKDAESLVRVEIKSNEGRLINLGRLLPLEGDGDRSVSIRFVAEGSEWLSVIVSHTVSHQRRLSLLMLHSSGLPEHSSLSPLDDHAEPRCLAVSSDNSFVAIGFGTKVLLLHYQGAEQHWIRILHIQELTNPTTAKFQAISFSGDNSCLVVSTQKRDVTRSHDDDVVYTHVWRCEPGLNLPLVLWPCKMPTDGQGLTTIHYHPVLSVAMITGMISTPYPLFLTSKESPLPPIPTTIPDFRIRCSCAFYLDQRNRVFLVDLRTRNVRQISDLNTIRGSLKPQEEPAAMTVTSEGQLRVFWRQASGLWCVDVDTRERLPPQKKNLRPIWMEAIGGA
ncbi:hypothetical protein F5Y15DRAFT_418445 [Xylariaceae sp. FL0016]|nr:hypothetical protein F5Y15DRAFT_418445 [Xylariaceae sp. FL0016]